MNLCNKLRNQAWKKSIEWRNVVETVKVISNFEWSTQLIFVCQHQTLFFAESFERVKINYGLRLRFSWLVFTLKLSTIKMSRAIDNTTVTKEYKQDVYCYLNFFPTVRQFAEYVNRPGRRRVGRCQISYKHSVKLSRRKGSLGYWRPYKWA